MKATPLTPTIIATFNDTRTGKPVELKSNTKYKFIEEEMEFYLDSDGIINSKCGCQWTLSDFVAEVNSHGSFPKEV